MKNLCLHLAIIGFTSVVSVGATFAQSIAYPQKPIRFLVGFTPAGSGDLVTRAVSQKLSEQMKTPFIVENRPGAGGNAVYETGAKAAPDGHTLILGSGGVVQNYALYKNLPYHPLRDFAAVSLMTKSPLLLIVNTSVPSSDTVAKFVAYAKANPDKLSYGSAGTGNITHLGNLLFQRAVGIQSVHVPYKGSAPAMSDLIANHVQFSTPTVASAMGLLTDTRLRPLMVMSSKRSELLPNVPTAHETVAPNLEVASTLGILLPVKTPSSVIKILNAQVVTALSSPELRSKLLSMGAEPTPMSPEQYTNYLRSEFEQWSAMIKSTGLSLEE